MTISKRQSSNQSDNDEIQPIDAITANLGNLRFNVQQLLKSTQNKKKKVVFCVDFSEIFPVVTYNHPAVSAFTLGGWLAQPEKVLEIVSKRIKDETFKINRTDLKYIYADENLIKTWKKLDQAVLNQLIFDTDTPIGLSDPHQSELLRLEKYFFNKTDSLSTKGDLHDPSFLEKTGLTPKILKNIRKWYEELEGSGQSKKLDEEHNKFLMDYLPGWNMRDVKEIVEIHDSNKRLQQTFQRSHLSDIFSQKFLPDNQLDYNDFIRYLRNDEAETSFQEVYDAYYQCLNRVRNVKKASSAETDAEAIALIVLVNKYLEDRGSEHEIQLISRTPTLLHAARLLDNKYNISVRHPFFIPEIYQFDSQELDQLTKLVSGISDAAQEYSDGYTRNGTVDNQPESVLAMLINELSKLLTGAVQLKDWESSSDDYKNKTLAIYAANTEDRDIVKDFLRLLSDSAIKNESLYQSIVRRNFKNLEKLAAQEKISNRARTIKPSISKSTRSEPYQYFRLSSMYSYMGPTIYFYHESPLNIFLEDSDNITLDSANTLPELRRLNDSIDNVSIFHSEMNISSTYRKYFYEINQGESPQRFTEKNSHLFSSSMASLTDCDLKDEFESHLLHWMSSIQVEAYIYALFQQHRYAAVLCSEALSILSPILNGGITDFDAINSFFVEHISDVKILKCAKELFLLRHYCSRALAYDQPGYKFGANLSMQVVYSDPHRPFYHFARADRDLHFANLVHRYCETENIHWADYDQLSDPRLLFARHAGYQENVLKSFESIEFPDELVSRSRNLFWTTASNTRSIDKLARQLRYNDYSDENAHPPPLGELDIHNLYFLSRAYQVNITAFLVFLSEPRLSVFDAFLDLYGLPEHKNILGFCHVFYWHAQFKDVMGELVSSKFNYSKKSIKTIDTIFELIKGIHLLKTDGDSPDPKEAILLFDKAIEGLQFDMGDTNLGGARFRDGSFYSSLQSRLLRRLNDCNSQLKNLINHQQKP